MRIDLLVLDGVFDLGFSALLDTLTVAAELSEQIPEPRPRLVVRKVGVRKRVRTAQGLVVPVEEAGSGRRADVVVVPALGCKTPPTIVPALARCDVRDACDGLVAHHDRGGRVLAACTGTFVLAETGLLDGGAATTTWWLAPLFRKRYPAIMLDESNMVVPSGRCTTAGAALAHLDLALWLVRSQSPALASLTSRYLLVDERPTVALGAIVDHLAHDDPVVSAFEDWARAHIAESFSLSSAAQAVGTSPRTLARRTKRTLGKTPLGYVQDLRVERAVHRLRTSDASVDVIAEEVGYGDGVTLRTLLRRKTGRGIRELRRVAEV